MTFYYKIVYFGTKLTLMSWSFTSPKMFWAGPNYLCQNKKLFTYCGSHNWFHNSLKRMMKFIDFSHLCLFFMTPLQKTHNFDNKDFEFCPLGYIEGRYYLFTKPSTAGTISIRMQVLFEGGPYLRKHSNCILKSYLRIFN